MCREVRSAVSPPPACLMLTSYSDDEALFGAIMAGASGYLLKQVAGVDLIGAVRTVATGGSTLDPKATAAVLDRLRKGAEPEPVERLFSYGTLRDPAVQRSTFGRELGGQPDRLPGYALALLVVGDPDVVAVSGSAQHPIVAATGNPDDLVEGIVLELTSAELTAADTYEVSDYARVSARLASGAQAWVYVAS